MMKTAPSKWALRVARSKPWTLKKIATRIRLGFGQGTLADYIPWLNNRDLSSKGTATRLWSPKTGRTMEFFSDIERNTFLVAEFRPDFVDYWEQWPLERNWTLWAAGRLRYRHSVYSYTTRRPIPVVMTVDGVLTLSKNGKPTSKAIDCKPAKALLDPRTKEKLAIARLACNKFAYPHIVVTDKSYSPQVIENILWVRVALPRPHEPAPLPGAYEMWPVRLHRHLLNALAAPTHATEGKTLARFCAEYDAANSLPRGLALTCMKLLMWEHLVEFDLNAPAPETLSLSELTVHNLSASNIAEELLHA